MMEMRTRRDERRKAGTMSSLVTHIIWTLSGQSDAAPPCRPPLLYCFLFVLLFFVSCFLSYIHWALRRVEFFFFVSVLQPSIYSFLFFDLFHAYDDAIRSQLRRQPTMTHCSSFSFYGFSIRDLFA